MMAFWVPLPMLLKVYGDFFFSCLMIPETSKTGDGVLEDGGLYRGCFASLCLHSNL
jgi:hypothetical protein